MTLGVDEWIWDGQHFKASDWAGQGYADPIKGYAACQAAAFRHLTSGDAQGARDAAIAARDAAATIKAAVEALVGQVTTGSTTALSFPSIDVRLPSAWSGSGATTAQPTAYGAADYVDVDFLDATHDTDFGDWTRKARAGSLYHEAASATRGWRKDVPLAGQILLRSGSLVILDGLDLDVSVTPAVPRLWAVFTVATGNAIEGTPTSVAYRQGRIFVSTSTGLYTLNLATDEAWRRDAAGLHRYKGTLADRNAGRGWGLVSAAGAIVAADCKHVAARVLPAALLDAADLPVPTVAVASAGGVSVIHASGQVVNISLASGYAQVGFATDGRLWAASAAGTFVDVGPLPYASVANTSWRSVIYDLTAGSASLRILGGTAQRLVPGRAAASSFGLSLVAEDLGNPAAGMTAFITKDYSTGWLPGSVVGAYLCDGTTGAITGSGELVTSGDGSSTTGWSAGNSASLSSVSGKLRVAYNGAATPQAYQTIATVAGQSYVVTVDAAKNGTAPWALVIVNGPGTGGTGLYSSGYVTSSVTGHLAQFTASSSQTTIILQVGATAADSVDFDSVSVKLGAADRSCKGKGLHVAGTLTRTAVATGADLAAWSGFSDGNHLEQPYSADYDFGTGDFFVTLWGSCNFGGGYHLDRDSAPTGPSFSLLANGTKLAARISDGTNSVILVSASDFVNVGRRAWTLVKRGSTLELWCDGNLDATASAAAVGSLNNTAAKLRIGGRVSSSGAATGLSVAMLRIAGYAPTPAQIRRMYAAEAPLFRPAAKAFLGGTSNNVIDVCGDESRGLMGAWTDQGLTVFAGLLVTAFYDNAAAAGWTAGTVRAGAMRNGMTLLASTAEAAFLMENVAGKEAVLDHHRRANDLGNRWMTGGVTPDQTPINLPLPVWVGEREELMIEARFVGRVYGATDGQRISYVRRATVYRDAGGVVTLQGSVQTIGTDTEVTSTADATLYLDTTNNAVFARPTGVAATRIVWAVEFIVTRISEEARYAA
ncbi:MAG TPA: hypothetical protein VD995_03005 [Azospirillum sp.]|nr:hypothetical protein [Azospirillum sp.]